MEAREKLLGASLGLVIIAWALMSGIGQYTDLLAELDEEAQEADIKVIDYLDLLEDFQEDSTDYELLLDKSLGSDINVALNDYKAWLVELLEGDLEISNYDIKNEPPRNVDDIYTTLGIRLNANGSLQQATKLLYLFETKQLLHRIKDLTVTPTGYNQYQLVLAIEAIAMAEAPSKTDVTAVAHSETLNGESYEDYWTRISNRNFFGPENKEPTFTPPPIAATVGEKASRTLTASAGPNEQNIQNVVFELDQDSIPPNFVATLSGNNLTVSSENVGTYRFNVKVTDNGLPAKTVTRELAVTVNEKRVPKPPEPMTEPPKPPEFNVAQLAFFTSTVEVNGRVQVWIHRRDLGEILKLPLGSKIEIGAIRGTIYEVDQRYLTILTEDKDLLEIKAGKALSTAENITAQAEKLLP